ncbi:hypothetical protein E2C01_033286 [Portunus trituberculatus]|uniref:Uncharacterized protein n=1 Tax=Portunus trituberculatus TaxID=210409 RepID=A0A5B7F3M3_PORTR|nr:hypothetical protein [Portunus trituberculatus]
MTMCVPTLHTHTPTKPPPFARNLPCHLIHAAVGDLGHRSQAGGKVQHEEEKGIKCSQEPLMHSLLPAMQRTGTLHSLSTEEQVIGCHNTTYLKHSAKRSLPKVPDVDDAVPVVLQLLQFRVQLCTAYIPRLGVGGGIAVPGVDQLVDEESTEGQQQEAP